MSENAIPFELTPAEELTEARRMLQWAREKNEELVADRNRLVGEVNKLQLALRAQREKHLGHVRQLEVAHSKIKAERRAIERVHRDTIQQLTRRDVLRKHRPKN